MIITRESYPSVAAGLNMATFPADLKVTYDLILEYNPGYTDWATFFDTAEGLDVQNLYFQKLGEYLDSLSAPVVNPPVTPPAPVMPVVQPPVPTTQPPAPPVTPPTNVVYQVIPIGTVPSGGGAVVGIVGGPAPVPASPSPVPLTPPASPVDGTTPAPGATNLTVTVTPPATDDTATGKKWVPYVLGGVGLLLVVVVGVLLYQRRKG